MLYLVLVNLQFGIITALAAKAIIEKHPSVQKLDALSPGNVLPVSVR